MKSRIAEGDQAVVARLLEGDERAFSDLVSTHQGSLLRLARLFVADRGAAEEVVQETWLGVIRGLKSFEGRSSLKTWIFRILVNGDSRTVTFSSLQPDDDPDPEHLMDRFSAEGRWVQPPSLWPEQDPEDLLLRGETLACLEKAIEDLPAAQRAVLTLRDVDGVDAGNVCNMLAISETNQRVLLHRARTRVRATLEKHLVRR